MNQSSRIKIKFIAILIGVMSIMIVCMLTIMNRTRDKSQTDAEYITLLEVQNLIGACDEELVDTNLLSEEKTDYGKMINYLTYRQYIELLEELQKVSVQWVVNDKKSLDFISEQNIADYSEKYKPNYYIEKSDWYTTFEQIASYFDLEDSITKRELTILALGNDIADATGKKLDNPMIFTNQGLFSGSIDYLNGFLYQTIEIYSKTNEILSVCNIINKDYTLENVWINEVQGDYITCFWDNSFVQIPFKNVKKENEQQIGDLYFQDGIPSKTTCKTEKIHGKLLQIKDGTLEIEGVGTYLVEDNFKIYKLYGTMERNYTTDLRIGYDFTDYVISDGKICACLITRDEAMENIRVLIKNSDYQGTYHNEIRFVSDSEGTINNGSDKWRYGVGEEVLIKKEDDFFAGNRITIIPDNLTSTITLLSVKRSQGNPSYGGTLEIEKTEEGLVVVNEILLEEYLYSVVPSEMPSYYPKEALEAQAVCARTYAYRKMVNAGLLKFGAHLDDSSTFQVYNNIVKTTETTLAVKETKGEVLYCDDQLVEAYYYSTSCGMSGNASIWKSDTSGDLTYLVSKQIGEEARLAMANGNHANQENSESLKEEELFKTFISTTNPSDYESEEGWYRWKYIVQNLDVEKLLEKLKERYQINNKYILTKISENTYEDIEPSMLGTVLNIYVSKRLSGGVADEMIIEGSKSTYKVISEYNIRYLLCNKMAKIIRQDGSEIDASSLIPSAFCIIIPEYKKHDVTGYTVVGGGFGHGVGLSQNGAKCMANLDFIAKEILTFFYEGTIIKNIYER
ncbi:MAG TPA: SpoIID/LytB domain-containing protein [Lachnospiraceae bacterium]|nr:SpoIID/LytB domain-containing protein [Lachnospiraceae bacterium]